MNHEKKENMERGSVVHILVFPGPGQGHINPLLQFVKRLVFKGIKATLAITVFIKKSMQADIGSIKIETISDGYDDGGYDSANSAGDYIERFKDVGSRTLAELIEKYENSDYPFTCIIYDPFFPWALDVAKRFGLSGAAFFTQSCAVSTIFHYVRQGWLAVVPPAMQDVLMPGLPPLRVSDLPSFVSDKGSYPSLLTMILDQFSNLDKADWIFINSFDKLECQVLSCSMGLRRMKTVGPTVPSMYLDKRIKGDNGYGLNLWKPNSSVCMEWLNTKAVKSVIYVSFGSAATLGTKQMEELAWGLRRSNHCFLWVVSASEQNKLPCKFMEELTSEKGLVVTWCPQLEVLAHRAAGCFVTHCGWNSTVEALSLGVPMVGVPQWTDQPTNAKFLEEVWRVGVRARVDEKGIVRREEIEVCIDRVMEGLRGADIRKNASRWRELAKEAIDAGGSSDRNIEEFFCELLRFKKI